MTKKCSGCGEVLPATSEHFHRQKNGRYGFTSKCKRCKNDQIRSWTERNPEMSKAQKVRWRVANRDLHLHIKRCDAHTRRVAKGKSVGSYTLWSE